MTAADTLATPTVRTHEHAWVTESAHATSQGRIRYVRCVGCPARRVDLDAPVAPPTALTRAVS